MLKKSITYTNFNGEEKTSDFYFNLTKTELVKLEASVPGGFTSRVLGLFGLNSKNAKEGVDASDVAVDYTKEIIGLFETLILSAYGKRSADGDSFIKNDQVREEFKNSAAYDVLFMELMSNPEAAGAFMKAVIPVIEKPATAPAARN